MKQFKLKFIFISLLFFFLSIAALFAQITSYSFSKSNGTYVPITGGTSLGNGLYSDVFFGDASTSNGTTTPGYYKGFPIGFNFVFDGVTFDRFAVCSNGWIKLAEPLDSMLFCSTSPLINSSINFYDGTGCKNNIISGFGIEKLKTFSIASKIRFVTSGVAPNRVLTVQWDDFTCSKPFSSNQFYRVYFQILLHETTNSIEYKYGNIHGFNSSDTTSLQIEVGIKGFSQYNNLLCNSDSSWDSTFAVPFAQKFCRLSYLNVPSSGLIYTFSPGPVCSGKPNAGKANCSLNYVCPTDLDTIWVSGADFGSGISYLWESSQDTISWNLVSGASKRYFTTHISATSYFRCILICDSGTQDTSDFVKVISKPAYLCNYCYGPSLACGLKNPAVLDGMRILGTTFHYKDLLGANCNPGNISTDGRVYDPVDSMTANLLQGQTITLNFIPQVKAYYFSMWMDYNHNGTFEAFEYFKLSDTIQPYLVQNIPLTIPLVASPGMTQVRFMFSLNPNVLLNSGSACSQASAAHCGDFIFFIGSQLPCISPPNGGIAISTLNNICPTDNPVILLFGSSTGTGLSYYWERSLDSLVWLNAGSTNPTITVGLLADTVYYRCQVTCNGFSSTSSVVGIYAKPSYQCYCAFGIGGSACSDFDFITHVAIPGTSLDNSDTLCTENIGSTISEFNPSINTTTILHRGSTYSLDVICNRNNYSISAWMDYNQNGIFSNLEYIPVATNSVAYSTQTGSFTVPMNATLGLTGLRIRSNYNIQTNGPNNACTNFNWGETEQYFVTIDVANNSQSEVTGVFSLQVQPNPAIENLNVSIFSEHRDNFKMQILNANGRRVYFEEFSSIGGSIVKSINVGNFPHGIYLLQIMGNNSLESKKVIIM